MKPLGIYLRRVRLAARRHLPPASQATKQLGTGSHTAHTTQKLTNGVTGNMPNGTTYHKPNEFTHHKRNGVTNHKSNKKIYKASMAHSHSPERHSPSSKASQSTSYPAAASSSSSSGEVPMDMSGMAAALPKHLHPSKDNKGDEHPPVGAVQTAELDSSSHNASDASDAEPLQSTSLTGIHEILGESIDISNALCWSPDPDTASIARATRIVCSQLLLKLPKLKSFTDKTNVRQGVQVTSPEHFCVYESLHYVLYEFLDAARCLRTNLRKELERTTASQHNQPTGHRRTKRAVRTLNKLGVSKGGRDVTSRSASSSDSDSSLQSRPAEQQRLREPLKSLEDVSRAIDFHLSCMEVSLHSACPNTIDPVKTVLAGLGTMMALMELDLCRLPSRLHDTYRNHAWEKVGQFRVLRRRVQAIVQQPWWDEAEDDDGLSSGLIYGMINESKYDTTRTLISRLGDVHRMTATTAMFELQQCLTEVHKVLGIQQSQGK